MVPAYRILTRRLELRCWSPTDAPELSALIAQNLEYLKPFMPWAHREPLGLDERVTLLRSFRARFDQSEDFIYGVFLRSDGRVVGGCGLHPRQGPGALEIGYWIEQGEAGKGLATELTAALTRVAFELHKMDRVEIRVEPANLPSAAIPRKLGFALEARLRRRLEGVPGGEPRDCEVYSLFAVDRPSVEAELEAFGPLGERVL